jgi:MscS family membrane protein
MSGTTTTAQLPRPEWLDYTFLDLAVWKYLAILGLLLAAMVTRQVVELLLRRYFRALFDRADLKTLRSTIERGDRAVGFLTFAVIIYVGAPLVDLPLRADQIMRLAARAMIAGGSVWVVFRILDAVFAFLAAKAERTASKLDDQLIPLLRRVAKVFIAVVGSLFALQNMDVDIGSLLAGLGLGGLAFALAAKDTVSNFFGSLVIFMDKPFTIGDWVVLPGDHEGIVEEVGFRTTRVRTFRNSLLTVPNAVLTTAIIDNLGARKYRRYTTTLGITYDTPAETVQAFCEGIRAVIAGMPTMRQDYYIVEFHGFGDFSLNVLVYCFFETPTWDEELRARSHLNLEILRLADRMGVRFAFPTSTLHVESLAGAGDRAAPHRAPPVGELESVIRAFGPGGELARPRGIALPSFGARALPAEDADQPGGGGG